jgi:hypothetical protein
MSIAASVPTSYGAVRFVELGTSPKRSSAFRVSVDKRSQLPITGVRLGPGQVARNSRTATRSALARFGYRARDRGVDGDHPLTNSARTRRSTLGSRTSARSSFTCQSAANRAPTRRRLLADRARRLSLRSTISLTDHAREHKAQAEDPLWIANDKHWNIRFPEPCSMRDLSERFWHLMLRCGRLPLRL